MLPALLVFSPACVFDGELIVAGGAGGGGNAAVGGAGGSSACPGCNDGNACTQDICDSNGACLHPAEEGGPVTQVLGDCKEIACDGTTVIVSADGGDIPNDDGNPCTFAACSGDTPNHPFAPAGTPCNSDGVCDAAGQCSGCDGPQECGTDTQCATYACVNNACATTYNVGLVISGDNDGDCKALQCADGELEPQLLPFVGDVASDANLCTIDTCSAAGDPMHDPAVAGSPCGSGATTECANADTCDATGVCQVNDEPNGTACTTPSGGMCTGGTCQ